MVMTKQEVRSEIARRVKNLSPVYCQEADEAICRLVVQSELCKAAQTVFCYAGSEREIDTTGLLHALLKAGKTVVLPLCREKGVMEARRIELEKLKYDLARQKATGEFNIDPADGEDGEE